MRYDKKKMPFFFTFKGLSNSPIFQYLNFSFHRHFKPLQIAPENTGNGISETPKIKKNFFLGVPPSAGIYPNPPFVKCWIRPRLSLASLFPLFYWYIICEFDM